MDLSVSEMDVVELIPNPRCWRDPSSKNTCFCEGEA